MSLTNILLFMLQVSEFQGCRESQIRKIGETPVIFKFISSKSTGSNYTAHESPPCISKSSIAYQKTHP